MGEAAPAVVPEPLLPATLVTSLEKVALYVGDLDAEVTEEDLVCMFASFGTILSTRVCRDRYSGESLRYAYVNFAFSSCAENALQALNHVVLKGKPVRIMWTDRNPIGRKSGVGNLFVKNLDQSIGGVELELLFRPYGQVISCKVQLDEKGGSRGFGFVQMNNEEAALSAIVALHGTVPIGACKKLFVAKFIRKCDRNGTPRQPRGSSNLYMKNLEKNFSCDILKEKFSEYGKVNSVVIMKDEYGNSKGFGFVSFESPEDAKKAMDIMNGAKLGSKILYVGPAQKKVEREKLNGQQLQKALGTTVYVKNLDDSINDKALQEHFALCGKILWSKAWHYKNGRSKGFGFVCFSSFEEASKAVVTLNGSKLNGKHLYVAIAEHRESRFNHSLCQHSLSLISHPPYYIGLPHDLASVYPPGGLNFPIGNNGFQFLPAPSFYTPQEQIRTYFRSTDTNPHLRAACHVPFNSLMHPIMVYLPQEAYYLQGRYVGDYYLKQRFYHPSRYEKVMKKTRYVQLQQSGATGVKKACSNTVPNDQQAMLCSTRVQEVLSKPWVLDELVKETTAKGLRVGDKVAGTTVSELTES